MQRGAIVRSVEAATTEGLRERKKRRTREALHDAAMRLFAERGYEATTVADIAAAADVAPRTFFAYFPTKDDVVFAAYDETLARFDALLAGRGPRETAIDALRAWIAALAAEPPISAAEERLISTLIEEHPPLARRRLGLLDRLEGTLAAEIARDIGPDADPLQARMVAAAATAVLSAMDQTVSDPGRAGLDDAQALAVLERAFAFLDAGLAAWDPGRG
jgi:AcrR family transcriptional regulator